MKKILLDTNMLLAPVQFRAGVYGELHAELYATDKCVAELRRMAKRKTKAGAQAKAALILAKTKNVRIIKSEGEGVDASIINAAREGDYAVATNDRSLINKLRAEGVPVIRLRQKKLLAEE